MNITLEKKIRFFVGIFPPDIEYFKKNFKSKAQTFFAGYVSILDNPLYKKKLNLIALDEKRTKKDCINILVGNRSKPILNHMEVLDNLVKFKDENIKIYVPLSYGNKEYGNKVEEKAKILFGHKAICIRELMGLEDYMDFLTTIDIAIFNTLRQIGLGNINPLLYMEKKVFMPAGSAMYDYYNSLGINICDYAQIQKIDFKSFIESVDMAKAKLHVINKATNKNEKIQMWSKVFNASV
ncbi:MAG: TDP-N-acetylfucosamine:lipid II N-acetylfucosaminyltransferase [Nitrososphaeraceae archaeon]